MRNGCPARWLPHGAGGIVEAMTATEMRARVGPPAEATASDADRRTARVPTPGAQPVVVAVDDSPAADFAVRDGVRLAADLAAPVVFVYVRRGPSVTLGEPYYQRRLDAEMRIGDRAIAAGIAAARRAGVRASGEQLHGTAGRRLEEFARLRHARLIVVGARRRRLGRSVSRAIIRRADRPVVVARRTSPARPDSRPRWLLTERGNRPSSSRPELPDRPLSPA